MQKTVVDYNRLKSFALKRFSRKGLHKQRKGARESDHSSILGLLAPRFSLAHTCTQSTSPQRSFGQTQTSCYRFFERNAYYPEFEKVKGAGLEFCALELNGESNGSLSFGTKVLPTDPLSLITQKPRVNLCRCYLLRISC